MAKTKGAGSRVTGGAEPEVNFRVTIAAWTDLLGYGSMLSEARYNPLHPKAATAKERLKTFHRVVAACSRPSFPTLVINDGAVVYRDLSFTSKLKTAEFLRLTWKMHRRVADADAEFGYPGARTVVAVGFRLPGRRRGGSTATRKVDSVFRRFRKGELTEKEAKQELSTMRIHSDVIPQLQANFAFTKAYVAESTGSHGGLPGPNLYFERDIVDGSIPDWMNVGSEVEWKCPDMNLDVAFVPLLGLRRQGQLQKFPEGMRNGSQIGVTLELDRVLRKAIKDAIVKKRDEARATLNLNPRSTGRI